MPTGDIASAIFAVIFLRFSAIAMNKTALI